MSNEPKLENYEPHKNNLNKHNPRGMGMLAASISKHGLADGITVAADGTSISGAARLETLADVMPDVKIVEIETDGNTLIVNRRKDLPTADDPRAVELGLAANRVAEVNWTPDYAVIATLPASMIAPYWEPEEVETWGAEVDEDDEDERSDGSLLELVDVTIKEPRHKVESGEVWAVGPHVLIIADVFRDWAVWQKYLKPGGLFAPFPGPFVAMTDQTNNAYLVMVQPDPYIAAHILDYYEDVHGPETVNRVGHN